MNVFHRRNPAACRRAAAVLVLTSLLCGRAAAGEFETDWGGGIKGAFDTSVAFGAQWRMEDRAPDLVGKIMLNPNLCPVAPNGAGTSCQGHLDTARHPQFNSYIGEGAQSNQVFVDAPGQASNNHDDGNLNFDRYELTQAVAKAGMSLSLEWRGLRFFGRGYAFYNTDYDSPYTLRLPNVQTEATTTAPGQLRRGIGQPATIASPTQHADAIRKEIGYDLRLLDAYVGGDIDLGERPVSVRVGRQPINWGESTLLIVNSLNTFSPPDLNALFRPAYLQLEEVLPPIGALWLSTELVDNVHLEGFWQYDWEPASIPPPGAFLSTVDMGTHNERSYAFTAFGKGAEDPDCLAYPDQLMLSAATADCNRVDFLAQKEPRGGFQGGLRLSMYADWLNDGTEIALYAARYHSRLPYVSFYAGDYGCLSGPGAPAPSGAAATDLPAVLQACPGADARLVAEAFVGAPNRDQQIGPDGTALALDSIRAQLVYPEGIALYGLSFNTNLGDLALQGEIAYRPHAPLQVDEIDLSFAALQNTVPAGCAAAGATCARGSAADRFDIPDPTNPGAGAVAQIPGARYALPDFVSAYRGRDPFSYRPGEFIRGWESFPTAQYNLGGTYIAGPNNWVHADQIIYLGEIGATQVFGLPDRDRLQIDGPATLYHASAGADGSGADGSARANSGVIGASGIRFNPQQQRAGYADDFAWGYRLITALRYESVLPGVSIENTLIWAQDVSGVAPGPGENFVAGRKSAIANIEVRLPRYAQGLSVSLGYAAFFGGGSANLMRDRDFVQAGARLRF